MKRRCTLIAPHDRLDNVVVFWEISMYRGRETGKGEGRGVGDERVKFLG